MKEDHIHPILSLEQLHIGYRSKKGTLTIAKDINASLKKGKMVCLLGKNGIGKSTLLRTISNVQPPLDGKILLGGQEIPSLSSNILATKIGLVLTEKIPDTNLTGYELIALGRQPYTNWIGTLTNEDKQQINSAIKQTNVADYVYKKYVELSDGQIQKIMIARVLAQNTDLITLDEPTTHLDIQNKVELFNTLKNLCAQLGKTVLLSTHEIQLALQMADELWLLTEDGLVAGKTQDLIDTGNIEKLFSSNLITFDTSSQQFIVNEV